MLVTIVMWLLRYLYNLYCWDFDRIQAYNALPSIHFRELWLAGLLSGGLYSLGNLCTILAVTSLGQGVGYSFVQTSMLVSGVWGIFFFGEVQGFNRILKWLLSSVITIAGILWLSYEHQGAVSHRRLLAIGM
jgi:glucose uptake protein GlcU